MSYRLKNRKVKAKMTSYRAKKFKRLRSQRQSENDELLANKSLGLSENDELLIQKLQKVKQK